MGKKAEAEKPKPKEDDEDDDESDEDESDEDDGDGKDSGSSSAAPAKSDDKNNMKVFVGGIPWSTDEATVRADFEECGPIEDFALPKDDQGRIKGIAFITYKTKAGLEAALKFDGDDYGGRTLKVNKAEARGSGKGDGKGKGKDKGKGKSKGKDGKGKAKGKGKGPGPKPDGCTSVVVKGLSYEATDADLQKFFGKCGDGPTNVKILKDRETGESRGMAFVDFDDTKAVDEAMKLTESELKGRTFFMDYSKPRES